MKKKVSGKAKSRVFLVMWIYLLVTGVFLFYLLIDATIGLKTSLGQGLTIAFFWIWIALLFYIENKFFKGLYDEWRNEQR